MLDMKKVIYILIILLIVNNISSNNNWFDIAKPCWASRMQKEYNYVVALYKNIHVDTIKTAKFNIAACSNYRLYVNGCFIGYGPSITAHGFFRVDEYDFSKILKKGGNILAVEIAGYNVDNFHIPNQSSFVQAELKVNGEIMAATLPHNGMLAFEMGYPGYRQYVEVGEVWQRPHLEKYKLNVDYLLWLTEKNFRLERIDIEETDKKELLPRYVAYPDYSIKNAAMTERGDFAFDQVYTGFIMVRLNVNKHSRVILCWDEVLDKGVINEHRQPHMNMELELEPGNYKFETFEPYTLKYLKLKILDGDCSLDSLSIRQYVNGEVNISKFNTNDDDINKIFKAAIETYKPNAVDYFLDCPQRERAGWLCDSYFTSRVAYCLSGNTKLEHNFFENYLLPDKFNNIPEGMLPMCYPADHRDGNFIPNWAMWFVLELKEYVERSHDYGMLVALKPKVLALLEYFDQYKNSDGLLENLNKWVFIEWSKANEFTEGVNYPTNMLYAKMLEVVGELYNLDSYVVESEKIKDVIRSQSYVNGFFVDNAIRKNGKLEIQNQNCSEVCQYYAFYFGIADFETYSDLWNKLVSDFGADRDEKKVYPNIPKTNAFIGNYLRLELLSKAGLIEQMVFESKKLFLYMATTTGTLWENVFAGGSCCHGFASHVAYVYYRDIVGINNINTERKEISITINENGLKKCDAVFPIKNELMKVKWRRFGKSIIYEIDVPKDYTVCMNNNTDLRLDLKIND